MNGLYPIIRRVRRPLLPVEVLADGHQAGAADAKSVMGEQARAAAGAKKVGDVAEGRRVEEKRGENAKGKANA